MEKKNIETITLQDAEVDKLKLEEEELVEEASSPEQPPEPEETLEDREQILTPARMVLKRFFRSKLSWVGVITLVALFLFAFVGPLFSPWGETETDNSQGSTTYDINRIEFTDPDGNTTTIQQVYTTVSPQNVYAPISWDHWLGTDDKGIDVLTQLMYGGRISLTLGFVVVILETLLGVLFGGLAGYFGKWVDQIIMRIVDILNCIPQFPILIIFSAVLDSLKVNPNLRIYYLMGLLTLIGWSGVARLVRGQILSLREQEFMVAEEALGTSVSRKIFKHLIPNVMPQLIVSMTLGLGGIILSESTLSYLGLGMQPPIAAWGTMISKAKMPKVLEGYFNMWGPPGLCIILAVLAFNFIGDGLRDAFDPKMKR